MLQVKNVKVTGKKVGIPLSLFDMITWLQCCSPNFVRLTSFFIFDSIFYESNVQPAFQKLMQENLGLFLWYYADDLIKKSVLLSVHFWETYNFLWQL